MGRGSYSRFVKRNRNDFMPSEIANISDFDREVAPRLPLNIERVIDGVRQFIRAVVGRKRKQLRRGETLYRGRVRQEFGYIGGIPGWCRLQCCSPGIGKTLWATSRDEAQIRRLRRVAQLRIHVRRCLVESEWPGGDHAGGKPRGQIRKQFPAIVVHARSC